jgi:hypothetical protein
MGWHLRPAAGFDKPRLTAASALSSGSGGDPSESVRTYLADVTPEKRRRDAESLLELLARVTGEAPQLWGRIIGFGQYHNKYPSGREGDVAAAGFAPRKAATTIYLVDGVGRHEKQLECLGPHTTRAPQVRP